MILLQQKIQQVKVFQFFKFVIWNDKGQMIDIGKIFDFSKKQVKNRILERYNYRIIFRMR